MAGYPAGEAKVLAQVQAVAGFGPHNAARGKWGILDSGKAKVYAILYPGEWSLAWISATVVEVTYLTIVQVWQSYTNDGETLADLQANVELLFTRFLEYRKLGDTGDSINDSNPRRGGEPSEMWSKGGNGPRWLRQDFAVEWKEHRAVSFAE